MDPQPLPREAPGGSLAALHRDGTATAGPSDSPSAPAVYVGLQYWRGLAAMLVVYFHAAIQAREHGSWAWPSVGRSGVDVAFVLSGFVMWTSTRGRTDGPLVFLRRRVARIVPLYWLVTVATAAVALVAPGLLRSTELNGPHLLASLSFLPWPSPRPHGRAIEDRIAPLVVPGWTLEFELLFYLLFAVALLAPPRRRFPTLAALIAATLALALIAAPLGPVGVFFGQGLLLEFLAGVAVGRWATGLSRLPGAVAPVAVAVGLPLLLWADWAQPGLNRALALGVPATLVLAGTAMLEREGRLPVARWLDRLGDASYSIYLTHGLAIAVVRIAVVRLGMVDPASSLTFVPASVAASVLLGCVVHPLVERPLVRIARRLVAA